MSFLLSTEALVELISGAENTAFTRWANTVGREAIEISVISIGQVRAAVDELESRDPRKAPLLSNLARAVNRFGNTSKIRVVSLSVVQRWAELRPMMLFKMDDGEVGEDTKLVIATALAADLTLVITQVEPWVAELAGHGLQVHALE